MRIAPGFSNVNLYQDNGFLDVPGIAENGAILTCIVGARRIGKTYGVLQHYMRGDRPFLYLRLTREDLRRCEVPKNNPFTPVARAMGVRTAFDSTNGYYDVKEVTETDEKGNPTAYGKSYAVAAPLFGTRGLGSGQYSALVLDEFIPDMGAVVRKYAGYNLKSAIQTVTDLQTAEMPIWLLANSNNLDNDILDEFGLIPVFERMAAEKYNCWMSPDGGTICINAYNSPVSEQLAETRLGRILNTGAYGAMAFSNKWANNNFSNVKRLSAQALQNYSDVLIIGDIAIMGHKTAPRYYVRRCDKRPKRVLYWGVTPDLPKRTAKEMPILHLGAFDGTITYDSFETKRKYNKYVLGGKEKL